MHTSGAFLHTKLNCYMLKIQYNSKNTIVKNDEFGTFVSTQGSKQVHFAGVKLFDYYWDTEYEDLTQPEATKKPGFRK